MRGGLQCVVPAVAADLSARLSSRAVPSPARGDERQLLLAAVQLLANFSVASEAAARAIWRECFPAVYEQLTATDDGGHGQDFLGLRLMQTASFSGCQEPAALPQQQRGSQGGSGRRRAQRRAGALPANPRLVAPILCPHSHLYTTHLRLAP
jgi:hypothetical protein